MLDDIIKLPEVPDTTFTIHKCNPIEREECKIFRYEVEYLKEQHLDRIKNRDIDSRSAIFSGMERDIPTKILTLCKFAKRIPSACPKIAHYTWLFNMEQLIIVHTKTQGIDYEVEAQRLRSSFGDIPNVDQMIIEELNKIQETYKNIPDDEEIISRLKKTGLNNDEIVQELAIIKEAAAQTSKLTWTFRFGVRCPNCQHGEIDKGTETCKNCGITYTYTIKRTLKMLRQKQQSLESSESSSPNLDNNTLLEDV